jgi:Bacteriocin-protection, YdeI or OmpD-Associated/Domain of unknown function (DUF1905)
MLKFIEMAIIQKFDNGMHYVMVDTEIVQSFLEKGTKRVLCTIGEEILHCALLPIKEGGHYICLGSKVCKKLKLHVGQEVNLNFSEDNSTYQFEMPEELQEVLDQDSDADAIFQSLTDGNKRGIIYLVTLVKSSEKRIERALLIATKLHQGITSPRLIIKK